MQRQVDWGVSSTGTENWNIYYHCGRLFDGMFRRDCGACSVVPCGAACPDLAARILRRLVARYGRDIVIIHGNEPGADASFDAAATEMGLNVEARVVDRKTTGFKTVGQRNRELLLGGADMCIAVHNRVASCPRTLDCVLQALQDGIPTYGTENQHAIPRRIKRGDARLH
jgi:hypothetical protein